MENVTSLDPVKKETKYEYIEFLEYVVYSDITSHKNNE